MGPGTGQGSPSRATPMDTLRALAGDITDFLTNRVEMVRANAPEMPSGTGRDRMDAIANRTPEEARAAYDAIWNNPFFGPMVMGIKAYHGSPHDFDKFDLSKIGTGEGAQAYGHGLYFAENEGVAKSYRDTLSKDPVLTIRTAKGKIQGPALDDVDMEATRFLELGERDAGQFKHNTLYYAKKAAERANRPDVVERLSAYGPNVSVGYERAPGRMYEVDINTTPDRLLDWDAPIAQQPIEVRNIANTLQNMGKLPADATGKDVWQGMRSPRIAQDMGYKNWSTSGPAEYLSKVVDIPGIQYLDQGSRAAGTGSRNYVIFDDSLINILRKYGILAPLMGAGAMEAVGGGPEEQ